MLCSCWFTRCVLVCFMLYVSLFVCVAAVLLVSVCYDVVFMLLVVCCCLVMWRLFVL